LRVFNRLIISLAITLSLLNVLLDYFKQTDISIYFIVNAIAYLVIVVLYVYLNPRTRSVLNTVSAIILGCFMVIVTLKVVEILK
jgi:hypothetical protein